MILRETILLAAVCIADLSFTIWLITTGHAVEANPILRYYVDHGGLISFAAAKILLFAGPLFVLELLRRHRPEFVRSLLRVGITLYLVAYTAGVIQANSAGASVWQYH